MTKKLSRTDEAQLLKDVIIASLNTVLPNTRIRLNYTTDKFTDLVAGSEGTISHVDDACTIHVNWDNGSTLGLVPDEDSWEIISFTE